MPFADRHLSIRRDPHSREVLARGGDPEARSILERTGFVTVVRLHEIYLRAPTGLAEDEEIRLATDGVARLRSAQYHVECDEAFDTDARPLRDLPLGASVAHLAEQIRAATTTDEVAAVLTEVTAAHDGILAALDEVLTATADFHDGLGQAADPHIARRLRFLADDHFRVVRNDLDYTRDRLTDRHASHHGRSICTQQAPDNERERSAVCACPPPTRTAPPPPAPADVGLRR
ncbi:hypothetical protein ABZ820_04925 [Streptomyces diacarni]|uniref:hypothetical protein n=1 Tax=Streptomyces diacarni TaxID=2800381 RepID=UPI0033D14538